MPELDEVLAQKLAILEARQQRRTLRSTERGQGVHVRRDGRELVSFCDNDYLGLAQHPEVIAAVRAALEKYGLGAGASRLVSGNHPLYAELETALASAKGTEAACVFGSGYLANLGAIPALVGKNDLIIADRLIHACMIDAAKLSGASLYRFAHNNVEHCRSLLEENRGEFQHCLILTETVFSMDGDRAPITELAKLAIEFDAWLMTDDAHGLGVVPHVAGAQIQMGTLSKAAGAYGGYVCGSKTLIDYLQTSARSLIYSTALPASVVAGAAASLSIIARDKKLVETPLARARQFTEALGLPEAQSAIVPLLLKEEEKALAASIALEEEGFWVAAIRPPTVPEGTARLRFAFSALHSEDDVARLIDAVKRKVTW